MILDLTPLFHSSVGFEHLNRILKEIAAKTQGSSYPPYNILKIKENKYCISIALAGFKNDEIEITLEDNILKVLSYGAEKKISYEYLYKGIANRAFEKKFQLSENIEIEKASLQNGLLNIDLIKIPPKRSKALKILVK